MSGRRRKDQRKGVEGKAMAAGTDKCCCGWSFNPVLSSSKQKEQALVHQQHGAARALKLKLFQSVTFGHRA